MIIILASIPENQVLVCANCHFVHDCMIDWLLHVLMCDPPPELCCSTLIEEPQLCGTLLQTVSLWCVHVCVRAFVWSPSNTDRWIDRAPGKHASNGSLFLYWQAFSATKYFCAVGSMASGPWRFQFSFSSVQFKSGDWFFLLYLAA